jgi:signal transduction histidine kinase
MIPMTQAPSFHLDAAAINEALLISGLHQHELTAEAVKLNTLLEKEINERKLAEAALQKANIQLADQAGELERLVAERTAKLRETVADLEAFSYSVAHDMRAPLGGMQGFARILLDSHAHQLDATAQDYLERIASSAARMDLLIQDVLNYTHVVRSEAFLAPVDLGKLIGDIIAIYPDLQPPRASIVIENTLPWVRGHEGFLTQCVSNLLSNAVKFVAPGVFPHVKIWAEDRPQATDPFLASPKVAESEQTSRGTAPDLVSEAREGKTPVARIYFQDNGIGITLNDRARVFGMFERINPAAQFEGTGIGLTIVRKAIKRLGGQVDFESEAGKGSKFWIELKKAPAPLENVPPLGA